MPTTPTNTGADKRFNDIPADDKPPLLVLPPGFSFVTVRQHAGIVWLAGQLPFLPKKDQPSKPGPLPKFVTGKIGSEYSGYQAARLVGLSLLVSLQDELNSLDRVVAVLQVIGAVNSVPGFTGQSGVMNGCTDLMVDVFGKKVGQPARMAYAASELPLNAAIEALMVVAIREE